MSEMRHSHEKPDEHQNRIEVVVEYVGKHDFSGDFPSSATFQDVKLKAMRFFGLELSAQDNYVLQYNGVDLPRIGKLESLRQKRVVFRLDLVREPVKG